MSTVILNAGNNTFECIDNEYFINETQYTFPITLQKAQEEDAPILLFSNNIPINDANTYFIIAGNNITIDGNRGINNTGSKVMIDSVENYLGLCQNGLDGVTGYSNVIIQNINIGTTGECTLVDGGGWICQSYFGNGAIDCEVTNCSSSGNITGENCGGIAGSWTSNISVTNCNNTGNITGENSGGIIGSYAKNIAIGFCHSTGDISGDYTGGIVGSNANDGCTSGTFLVENSYNEGSISGSGAGGIYGFYANNGSSVDCKASNCQSEGIISGNGAGGIFGKQSNNASLENGNCIAEYCIVSGNLTNTEGGGIFGGLVNFRGTGYCQAVNCAFVFAEIAGNDSGGIFGYSANYQASGYCVATDCYSYCLITGTSAGGIFGSNSNYQAGGSCRAVNCFSLETEIDGENSGGIFGAKANNGASGYCEASNCFSVGNITGSNSGGIFGTSANFKASGHCDAINCYSIGEISDNNAGGIFGSSANSWEDVQTLGVCTATNCYSRGVISGTYAGGIYGSSANYNSTNVNTKCTALNCYSTGNINGTSSGGIFGNNPNGGESQVGTVKAENCYTCGSGSSNGIFSSDISEGLDNFTVNNITGTKNFSEANSGNSGTWSNTNAIYTNSHEFGLMMKVDNTYIWLIPNINETNVPFLLLSYNKSLYSDVYTSTVNIGQYTSLTISDGVYGNVWFTNNQVIVSNDEETFGQLTSNISGVQNTYVIHGTDDVNFLYAYNINNFELIVNGNTKTTKNPNNSSILYKLVNTTNKKYIKRIKKYINDL